MIFSSNAGVTQLVECNLAKVDVEGSNPFTRSPLIFIPKESEQNVSTSKSSNTERFPVDFGFQPGKST